jgi:adenosylcobinamide kinase/adenosylcobinamide-phosphate guanylyltransferase
MLPHLTLILGGAASGKSTFAETLATDSGHNRIYIATAQSHDDEMRAKIARHQHLRGTGWTTIEEPLELPTHLAALAATDVVLLDCATMWLTNHLLAESDLETAQSLFLNALANCPAHVIVVSNEVGSSVVPENALARRFREAQGRLNQAIAAQSDLVVTVIAGLPLTLKGTLL